MTQLFNLVVPNDRQRGGIDAHLLIDGQTINFELKSTTSGSVSTVRDFGPDHIRKWRDDLHWLFGFYNRDGTQLEYCIYASPADMEPWIAEKERYVLPDLSLAVVAPSLVTSASVISLLGEKDVYDQADARWIAKMQLNALEYRNLQDLPDGYSLERMTELMRERCRYLILRGSTLNNPHIERSYFQRFDRITVEHASELRTRTRSYLASASATDLAIT